MRLAAIVLGSAYLLLPLPVHSQVADPPPSMHVVSVEVLHPLLSGLDNVAVFTGGYFVGSKYRIRPDLLLMIELPFSILHYQPGSTARPHDATTSAIGNPYVGAALRHREFRFEGGVRLPFAGVKRSTFTAQLADLTRWEAFSPDLLSVGGSVSYLNSTRGVDSQLSIGPTLFVLAGDTYRGPTRLSFDYGVQSGFQLQKLRVEAQFDGRAWLTGVGSVGERSTHQAGGAASWSFGRVRPAVHGRYALDGEARGRLKGVVGVSLEVLLGHEM